MKVVSQFTLFDDKSTRTKNVCMTKFEICADDLRQPQHFQDLADVLESLLEWGKTYKITIEEVNELDS